MLKNSRTKAEKAFPSYTPQLVRRCFITVLILGSSMTMAYLTYIVNERSPSATSISRQIRMDIGSLVNLSQNIRSAMLNGHNLPLSSLIDIQNSRRRDPCSVPKRNTGVEDLLCMRKPEFLPNFKNPCWYEEINSVKILRCLPYFYLFGVCKSGTSDFFRRIYKHPQIVPNNGIFGKELWYWTWKRFEIKEFAGQPLTTRTFSMYLNAFKTNVIYNTTKSFRQFSDYHPLVTGHGDPMDFWDQFSWPLIPQNNPQDDEPEFTTPQTIRHVNPDVKLVLMLRNPVDRLYSDFFHWGGKAEKFHEKTVKAIETWNNCTKKRTKRSCIYDRRLKQLTPHIYSSMYSQHLKEWLSEFPREQMFIFRNEDYHADMNRTLLSFFKFLDIDTPTNEQVQEMLSMGKFYESARKARAGPMENRTRNVLENFYRPFNKELAEMLSNNDFLWKTK